MSYFKIFTKGWKLQNKIISAVVDLFVDESILFSDKEVSLNLSIPNLLETAFLNHTVSEKNPIFVCSCEDILCDNFDFEITHLKDCVLLENFVDASGRISDKSSLAFKIPEDMYRSEIKKLSMEYLDFCNALESIGFVVDIKQKIEEKVHNLNGTEQLPTEDTIDIYSLLKKYPAQRVINFLRNFTWKIEEIIELLNSHDEVIRYRSIEVLSILSYFESIPYLILKIPEETEEIKYAIYKYLCKSGVLRSDEFLDEVYIRRIFRKGCRKQFLSKKGTIFPLYLLFQNKDEKILSATLSCVEKMGKFKDKDIIYTLLKTITNKENTLNIRKRAVSILKNLDCEFVSCVKDIIQDKTENIELRLWCIQEAAESQKVDYLSTLWQIYRDRSEPLVLRDACKKHLTKVEFYRKVKPSYILIFCIVLFIGVLSILNIPVAVKLFLVIISLLSIVGLIFYELF